MKYEKYCGAVVYDFHNDYPFVPVEFMEQGCVSLPRGLMKEGETEEETAVRVLREETNLDIFPDKIFRHEVTYSPDEGVQKTVVFFVAATEELGRMKPQKGKVAEIRMMGIDYAIRQMTYEMDKEVMHHAASYLAWKYYHTVWDGCGGPAFPKLLYREFAVDIHSHIIPGVDDGAVDLDEAVDLAYLDRNEGIDVIFATPHFGKENGYAPDKALVASQFEEIEQGCNPGGDCNCIPSVCLGTEWYCSDDIVERIRNGEAYPMGKSDWYMVEFLEYGNVTEPADVMIYRLAKMRLAGINTILAHPERYQAIQQDWGLAKRICDLGVLLQVNAYDLYLNKNDATRSLAQWMAREKLISFIGSDMHGNRKGARMPRLKEGIHWLYENVDEEYADDVVRRNAEKYLGIEKLPVDRNRDYFSFPADADSREGPDFLKLYRIFPDYFMPLADKAFMHHPKIEMVDRRHKVNMYWGAGVLEGNRPYFAENWGIHMLGNRSSEMTVYMSSEGLDENWQDEMDMLRKLGLEKLIEIIEPQYISVRADHYTDGKGNEYFAVYLLLRTILGDKIMRWKGKLFPYEMLNKPI